MNSLMFQSVFPAVLFGVLVAGALLSVCVCAWLASVLYQLRNELRDMNSALNRAPWMRNNRGNTPNIRKAG